MGKYNFLWEYEVFEWFLLFFTWIKLKEVKVGFVFVLLLVVHSVQEVPHLVVVDERLGAVTRQVEELLGIEFLEGLHR